MIYDIHENITYIIYTNIAMDMDDGRNDVVQGKWIGGLQRVRLAANTRRNVRACMPRASTCVKLLHALQRHFKRTSACHTHLKVYAARAMAMAAFVQ